MKTLIESYIAQFQEVFNGKPWLDETFAKKLDVLTNEQVFAKSPGNNHSVAEVVSHIVVWRMEELRRMETGGERRLEMDGPENWKSNEELQQKGWQTLFDDLKTSQKDLIDFLKDKDDTFLLAKTNRDGQTREYFIAGLLHHDLYHLGQIGLIIKMTGGNTQK